ncbi:MAG: RHS repeat-associated core domain-containing protein, partial [Sulfuriferula sp.]
ETGLTYNYFRDYDASTGRYVQSDPIGLMGGINTYAYANQNPLKFVDPEGLSSDDLLGGGGSARPPLGIPDVSAQAQQQLAKILQSGISNTINAVKNACSGDTSREECQKECVAQYERDAKECGVANAFWGKKGYQACMSRAGEYLGQCTRQCDGK